MGIGNQRVKKWISFAMVVLGNLLYALSVKLFLLPAELMSCGTTGIALIVNHLTDLPITVFIFCFNVVMLALGWWVLGRQFAMTTVFSSLFYPLALEILDRTLGDIVITEHIWLNVLFAGIGLGISLGLVIRGGASTGGMDIPPLILERLFRIPVSISLAAFDLCIILAQAFYHEPEDLLLGILLIIVISISLNKATVLGSTKTEVRIVSEKSDEIRAAILTDVDRGVTLLHGKGGYLQQETDVIMSIISDHELPKIERLARSIDPACFMIVTQVKEVWGRGFSYSKVEKIDK
jgi:uncharacterized membrane-anchored protein YitT (DUF2179 family)